MPRHDRAAFHRGPAGGAGKACGEVLPLRSDMASPSVGSNHFPAFVSENPPDLVDWLAGKMRVYGVSPRSRLLT